MSDKVATPLLVGLVEYLGNNPHVSDVKLQEKKPANLQLLTSWEVKYGHSLPGDLQQFYLTTNGFTLKWRVTINGDLVNVGHIHINSVQEVCPLAPPEDFPLAELDVISNHGDGPSFTTHPMFVLSEVDCGRVCLCYEPLCDDDKRAGSHATIWLLDSSWTWHHMTNSFTHFFRLAICHLGLPEWPLLLTSYAMVSPQHQAWYHMFIPNRLKMDLLDAEEEGVAGSHDQPSINVLDVGRIFRRSHDPRLSRDKKKSTSQKGTMSYSSRH